MPHAEAILTRVQDCLVRLAADRPFRFQDTTRADAQEYLGRLQHVEGYDELEIARAEQRAGGPFPGLYRAFLKRMGKQSAAVFAGSVLRDLDDWQEDEDHLAEILQETGMILPADTYVIMTHQGYCLYFTALTEAEDAPVWYYNEGWSEPQLVAPSFEAFLNDELVALEKNHADAHEQGGTYLTIGEGYVSSSAPALSSGERPLDHPDVYLDDHLSH